jgi:hypothetical protein
MDYELRIFVEHKASAAVYETIPCENEKELLGKMFYLLRSGNTKLTLTNGRHTIEFGTLEAERQAQVNNEDALKQLREFKNLLDSIE